MIRTSTNGTENSRSCCSWASGTICATNEAGWLFAILNRKDNRRAIPSIRDRCYGAFIIDFVEERSLDFFFSSKGSHLANFVNKQLHSPLGKNIGHFLPEQHIFIDLDGRYLGELVSTNRLMYNRSSSYRYTNFGVYGNYGDIGSYGTPGNPGTVSVIDGYEDIDWANLQG